MDHFYKNIQGFFNYENVYKKVIDEVSDNAHFVEIGVWKGRSVCFAAVEILKSGKNIKIDAVDSFEGSPKENPTITQDSDLLNGKLYDVFIQNIEPVKNIITPIKMFSLEASKLYEDSSLDFVFIDGLHSYEACYSDIKAWYPKVKKGGYIGGHDIDGPEHFNGVRKAVDEFFPNKNDIEIYNIGWASWLHQVN
jgi:cephalosporin hydroxylase